MSGTRFVPFERRFRRWAEDRGVEWVPSVLRCGPEGEESVLYRFTPPGGARRVLIAFHGAGNDALFGWIGLFKRQLLRGTEIVTFDLPGHGRGSKSLFSPESATVAARSAIADVDVARPGLPIHALGVSLGGSVLLAALPAVGARLASAALVVAPLRIELSVRSVLSELRPANFALVWREREHYGLTGLIPSFGPFKRDVYPLRLRDAAAPGAFGYLTALNAALAELKLEDAARATATPVLLAYGARDRVVPIEQGERLAGLIPRSELLRIGQGSHLSTPMSQRLLERLDTWLDP